MGSPIFRAEKFPSYEKARGLVEGKTAIKPVKAAGDQAGEKESIEVVNAHPFKLGGDCYALVQRIAKVDDAGKPYRDPQLFVEVFKAPPQLCENPANFDPKPFKSEKLAHIEEPKRSAHFKHKEGARSAEVYLVDLSSDGKEDLLLVPKDKRSGHSIGFVQGE